MKSDKTITLLGVGLGGVISVTSASGHYNFIDAILGVVLISLLWPMLRMPKAGWHERVTVCGIAGLSVLLIFGVFIDYFVIYNNELLQELVKESFWQYGYYEHFITWLGGFMLFLVISTAIEKQSNKANVVDANRHR